MSGLQEHIDRWDEYRWDELHDDDVDALVEAARLVANAFTCYAVNIEDVGHVLLVDAGKYLVIALPPPGEPE